MIARRDILIGGACLGALGAGYALEPRKRFSLLGAAKLAQILPMSVAGWSGRDVSDLAAPQTADSLQSKLYGEVVERVYQQASSGAEVMMLMAHGDSQTNDLQLHRPEVCYPAFGYELSQDRQTQIPLAAGVGLPARRLIANAPGRQENIVYWSRLGEFLPVSGNQQRFDRLRTAMTGYVADGLLARFSMIGTDAAAALETVETFIPLLVMSVASDQRRALVGTQRASSMSAARI